MSLAQVGFVICILGACISMAGLIISGYGKINLTIPLQIATTMTGEPVEHFMRLCKDCQHARPSPKWESAQYKYEEASCALVPGGISLMTGLATGDFGATCKVQRSASWWADLTQRNRCGPAGRNFQPREQTLGNIGQVGAAQYANQAGLKP